MGCPPMANDRPVASVSGNQDWAWNRWQAERQTSGSTDDPPPSRPRGGPPSGDPRCRAHGGSVRRDVRTLEDELDRTERRLQSVITRYERILTEKNRQLDEGPDGAPAPPGLLATLSNAVRRLVLR